jgi:hypothetical protein
MTGADDGDSKRTRDGAVYDVGTISMSMHDIRTVLQTERPYRAPLADVITIADIDGDYGHSVCLKRDDEGVRLVSGREHQCDAHVMPAMNMADSKLADDALEPTEMRRCEHVQDGERAAAILFSSGM